MLKTLVFVITCVCCITVCAQKKFDLTISFADSTICQHVAVSYDDGKNTITVRGDDFPDENIHITGSYAFDFAALEIAYLDAPEYYSDVFFVKDTVAKISFARAALKTNMFKTYTLTHAYSFEDEKARMAEYDKHERAALKTFTITNGEKIFSGEQPYYDRFWQMHNTMYRKDFEFVCNNTASYYLLWYYKNKIAQSGCVGVDTLLTYYHSVFPEGLRNSYEGRRLEQLLYGRANTVKGRNAPEFLSADITGKPISKKQFKNNKYVLLHFWATWCVPCMAEMNQITTIRQKYPKDFIEIIAVDFDKDSTKFIKEVNKGKMDWTHIYRDMNLYYAFGNRPSIPQVFLMNKDGMVIYSREEEKDYHLDKLLQLLSSEHTGHLSSN